MSTSDPEFYVPPGLPAEAAEAMRRQLTGEDAPAYAGRPAEADDGGLALLGAAPRGAGLAPLTLGELPGFIDAVRPIFGALASGDLAEAISDGESLRALIRATAIGARVERDWLEAQTAEVLVELAVQVIEANADFFVRRLTPALTAAAARVTAALGGTPLPGFSASG